MKMTAAVHLTNKHILKEMSAKLTLLEEGNEVLYRMGVDSGREVANLECSQALKVLELSETWQPDQSTKANKKISRSAANLM